MNEYDFFKQMIHDRAVDDALVKAKAKQKTHSTLVWKKTAAIAAAAAAVLIGTVFLIPSARAEVLSWFGATRPEEYLMTDPEERTPVDALDVLIVSPATAIPESSASGEPAAAGSSEEASPVGAVTDNRIVALCDEPIWQSIAEDFCVELGETMFDGHDLYCSITMHGLTALNELEPYNGGNATQVRIGKKDLKEYFEGGRVPEEYKNGTISLYEPMKGRFFLRLDDGTDIPFGPMHTIDFPSDLPRKSKKDLLTDDDRAEISSETIEWLQGKAIRGVIRKQNIDSSGDWFFKNGNVRDMIEAENVLNFLLERTDEKGILTGTVRYVVGSDAVGEYSARLEAELGTASFDFKAYQSIAKQSTEALDETVAWGAETVLISKVGFDFNGTDDDADDRISLYKQRVSMDGVTMTVETDEAEISALGVRDINIRIDVPESWTQDDREALAASLTFDVLINGERGDWIVSPYYCEPEDDGTVLFKCIKLLKVPYDKLTSIRTISFVPVIRSVKAVDMQTQDDSGRHHESIGILDTEYGKTTWSPYGVTGWNETFDRIEYPQYAITLTVQ